MKIENILGAIIATLVVFFTGMLALLQQEGVAQIADISELSWVILTIGSLLGFLKDAQALATRALIATVTSSSTVKSPGTVGVLTLLLAVLMLSGCSGTRTAYSEAEGLEETAKVISEHYFALVREANDLAERGSLTGSSLATAQDLVRSTSPVIIELSAAAKAWNAIKNAENEAALERAISDAAIAVSRLVDVIKGRSTAAINRVESELNQLNAGRSLALAA